MELNYGKSFSENNSYVTNKYGTVTITPDNAYLDPTIAARMVVLGSIPAVAYLDLHGSYKRNDNIQMYGTIDNVINTLPPIPGGTTNALNPYDASIRDDTYDAIGRSFRIGVRVKY